MQLFFTKRTTLQTRIGLDAQTTAGACDQATGSYQSFPRPEKGSFSRCCWDRLDHELWNQSDWEESHRVSGCFFAYENKPILQDFNLLVQAKDRIGIVGDNGVGNQLCLTWLQAFLSRLEGQVMIGKLFASPISLNKLRVWMKANGLSITCRKWQKRSRPAVVLRLLLQSY